MKTLTLEVEIAIDGTLHLDISSGLPPGKAEVILSIQPVDPLKRQSEQIQLSGFGANRHSYLSTANSSTDVRAIEKLSRKERLERIRELLNFALEKVEWAEIKDGRRDRCF